MFVDHLIQYRISSWPKTTEERGFGTCVTDGHTDGRTDKPSYRDAFLSPDVRIKKPGQILGYPSRVLVGRGSDGEE